MAITDYLETIFNKTDADLRVQNVPTNPGDATDTVMVTVGQDVVNQYSNSSVANQDSTTQKANREGSGRAGAGGNTPPIFYYPEELENPANIAHNDTPTNIIRFDIKEFTGGTLETETIKYQRLLALDNNSSAVDVNTALTDPVNPTNDRIDSSTLISLGQSVLSSGARATKDYLFGSTSSVQNNTIESARNKQALKVYEKLINPAPVEPDLNPLATIYLYAPENIQSSYNFGYKEEDLSPTYRAIDLLKSGSIAGGNAEDNKKAEDILKQAGTNFISSLTKSIPTGTILGGDIDLNAAFRAKTRTLPVQNFEYLFDRVNRRSFNYFFKMYPKSRKEIRNVIQMITAFKHYSHPAQANDSRYFKSPSVFQIGFYTRHQNRWVENLYMNKIKPCALESISINYTDAGRFTTLKELEELGDSVIKSPVGISIDLKFQELQILTRSDIAVPETFFNGTDMKKRYY